MAIVRIKFEDIKTANIININGGITASKIIANYKPDAFVNLALYDTATKQNIVYMMDNKTVSGYLFSEHGIGITKEGKPIWCNLTKAKESEDIIDFVGGAPVLVVDAKENIYWGNKVSTQIQGEKIRTAIGINDTELILYVSEDTITLATLASRMLDYGCKYAINCDGGGSSHLQDNNRICKSSSRANPSWLLINKKEVTQMPKRYKVCIDPGHGGSDPGAVSGKLYEKDINLEVGLAMRDFLQAYVDVIMTRDTDKTVSLEERAEIANKADVDFFFSIHCNSAANTAAKGWECFVISKGGNAEKLAIRVQAHVFEEPTLTLKNRGIKTASYYVLRYTDAPAVLVENAFISNSDDRVNVLKSDYMLNYLASSYCTAILEMLGVGTEIKQPEPETNDFEIALNILENKKVITSTEYWKNNASKLQYLEQLIINMAKYIEENG